MPSILLSFFFVLALIVVVQSFQIHGVQNISPLRSHRTVLAMGGNKAKFGIFSPAVYAAKYVLGEAKLNKVKIILHLLKE